MFLKKHYTFSTIYTSFPKTSCCIFVTVPAPRRRDSLLASLEKKAVPRGMIIFAPSGADPELSCDLISALTDADMEIIENYASRLEEALGGDSEDAYAIAMDSFIRGAITFHNTQHTIHNIVLHRTTIY